MISVDTLADNTAFAKKNDANFPLLADPSRGTATKYGVLRQLGTEQVANRWTFYIGADGKILDIDKKVNTTTAGADLVAKLKALKVPSAKS